MIQRTFLPEINSYQDWRNLRWFRNDKKVFFLGRNVETAEIITCSPVRIETNQQREFVSTTNRQLKIDPRTNVVTYCRQDPSLVGTRVRVVRYRVLTPFQRNWVESALLRLRAYSLISRFPKEAAILLDARPFLGTIWPSVDFLRTRYDDTLVRENQEAFVSLLKEHAATAGRFVTVH